jgi:hypothetical protein
VTVLVGIFLLHGFKDLPLSLDSLNVSVLRQPNGPAVQSIPLTRTEGGASYHHYNGESTMIPMSERDNSLGHVKIVSWRRPPSSHHNPSEKNQSLEEERQLIASSDSEGELYSQRNGR